MLFMKKVSGDWLVYDLCGKMPGTIPGRRD
jgi:hypothetical protein